MCRLQCRNDGRKMAAIAHQQRDLRRVPCIRLLAPRGLKVLQRVLDNADDATRLLRLAGFRRSVFPGIDGIRVTVSHQLRMPGDCRLPRFVSVGIGFTSGIRDLTLGGVRFFGHQQRKGPVHPFDDAGPGAKVHGQLERLQCDRPDAVVGRLIEQFYLSLAKTIDRLHRIAHQEKRAPIIRAPAAREFLQQFKLRA